MYVCMYLLDVFVCMYVCIRYIRKQWILSCFPLHNRPAAEELETHWQRFPLNRQPLYEIKEYFGEKVGLYFSFIEHYVTFLCIPAVVGLPLQIAVFALNDYSGQGVCVCVCLCVCMYVCMCVHMRLGIYFYTTTITCIFVCKFVFMYSHSVQPLWKYLI